MYCHDNFTVTVVSVLLQFTPQNIYLLTFRKANTDIRILAVTLTTTNDILWYLSVTSTFLSLQTSLDRKYHLKEFLAAFQCSSMELTKMPYLDHMMTPEQTPPADKDHKIYD